MPERTDSAPKGLFIPQSLRPFVGVADDGTPPLGPASTPREMAERAVRSLEPLLGRRYAQERESDPLPPDAVFEPAPDVISTEVGDEAVLLDLHSGNYFSLNRVGAFLWRELAEARQPLDAVRARLRGRFDVSEEVARRDLVGFVNHLKRQNLVTQRVAA
jgi:hypothetical protein